MKSKIFSSLLCFALLNAHVSLFSEEQEEAQIYLSAIEVQEIFNNPDRSYVYIGEVSEIPQTITEISKFDENKSSLVWALADHIERGFVIGNYEAVTQSLEQARIMLRNNAHTLTGDKALALAESLYTIIEQVKANRLNLNAEMLSFLKDEMAAQNDASNALS